MISCKMMTKILCENCEKRFLNEKKCLQAQAAQALFMNHTRNTSNYKGLYGVFYKISIKVVKSENIQ